MTSSKYPRLRTGWNIGALIVGRRPMIHSQRSCIRVCVRGQPRWNPIYAPLISFDLISEDILLQTFPAHRVLIWRRNGIVAREQDCRAKTADLRPLIPNRQICNIWSYFDADMSRPQLMNDACVKGVECRLPFTYLPSTALAVHLRNWLRQSHEKQIALLPCDFGCGRGGSSCRARSCSS